MAEMWYYTTEGKQMDPVSMKELKRLVGDGTLKPTDMVWKEGMARWIRASSVKELFPDPIAALDHYFSSATEPPKNGGTSTAVSPSAAAANAGAAPTPAVGKQGAPQTADEEEEAPRKKRRSSGNDDDRDDDRKPPRRRTEAASGGSSTGIIIGIVCALGVLFIACGGGLFIIIWAGSAGMGKGEPINGQVNYNVSVGPGGTERRVFTFRRGVDYELKVTSQPREPDVDLFVIGADGRTVASDELPGPDCLIPRWSPNETGDFRVEVRNLHNMLRVTSTVTIRELPANQPPPPAEKDKKAPPKEGLEPLPPDVREGSGSIDIVEAIKTGKDREFKFRVRAGHKANFRVVPSLQGANIDFNLTVHGNNGQIAADERPDTNATVDFTVPTTQIVRVRVINASKGPGTNSKAKLFFDVSP